MAIATLLKKALAKKLIYFDIQGVTHHMIPLSRVAVTADGWQYTTAIAQRFANCCGQDVATLAHHLAKDIDLDSNSATKKSNGGTETVLRDLTIVVGKNDYLILRLTQDDILRWLRSLATLAVPAPVTSPTTTAPLQSQSGHLPLCDRLQLSLPMLLQWAHARCTQKLIQLSEAHTEPERSEPRIGIREQSCGFDAYPKHLPMLITQLIQATDAIGVQRGQDVALRQGYAIAAAFYQLDASIACTAIAAVNPAAQTMLKATLQATRQFLAIIISDEIGWTPLTEL